MCVNPQVMLPYWSEKLQKYTYKFSGVTVETRTLIDEKTGEVFEPFEIGCGKCLECINLHKLQWTHRLLDEASCHKVNTFLTLTYAPGSDFDNDLHPEHVQLFIKRLRRCKEPLRLRYYLCGEYGSKGKRPHYHVVVFGAGFDDAQPYRYDRSGYLMCRSGELEKLWQYGFSSILPVNEMTLGYVTKDMQKLLPLEDGRHPPFTRMSSHPGIGADGWNRSLTDGKLWHDGKSCPLPRYYRKLADREELPGLRDVRRLDIKYAANRAQLRNLDQKIANNKKKLEKLLK